VNTNKPDGGHVTQPPSGLPLDCHRTDKVGETPLENPGVEGKTVSQTARWHSRGDKAPASQGKQLRSGRQWETLYTKPPLGGAEL